MEFFYHPSTTQHILEKNYNFSLVTLSVVIAIISAFAALGILERINAAKTPRHQLLWVLFGAIIMSAGVWSMHFIGLLALILPIPVSYNPTITALSILPVFVTSSLVLWIKKQDSLNANRLALYGILLGGSIGLMHYMGMMAIEIDASMYHVQSMFILSILVAILLATTALKIQSAMNRKVIYRFIDKMQLYSAIVMGLAISGMHYIAMQAVIFVQNAHTIHHNTVIHTSLLVTIISTVMSFSLLLAIITPMMLRYRQMSNELLRNEEYLRIAATAFQTNEAIMITDANADIVRVNAAFVSTTGFTEAEVLGKNPRLLSSGKHNTQFYKNIWTTILTMGNWSGEIWNRRKNGEIYPEWQTISAVKDAKGLVTHYVSFFSDITEFKKSKQEIQELAYYDPLTNLPNRRLLYERLGDELNIAQKFSYIGGLLFLDLDRFKNINDSLGHSIGDHLLCEVAARLAFVKLHGAIPIRLGGDEFIILIGAQNNSAQELSNYTQAVAEDIIENITQSYFIAEHDLYISTSIGITLFTEKDDSVDLILKRADTAMYHAKDAGRNTYCFYQQRMQEEADVRLIMEKNLRKAIEKQEFSIHYQPQSLLTGDIVGAEALIRWQQAEQGIISPTIFIPVAEETGLIIAIGNWVIEAVCRQIKTWDLRGMFVPHIAVNISPKQFHQADFSTIIIKILETHEITPDRILLEITEGVFIKNIADAIIKMNTLREYGFKFSIDDFGTGYSSLSYLKCLPFDQLKIDQSFINDLLKENNDAAIIQAIVVMAEGLKMSLIAEGVETNSQLICLANYGCHYFQGYYFSKPLTAEKFANYFLH